VTYLFVKKFTKANTALAAGIVLLFATPLIYLVVYQSIWSHLLAFLLVSTFVYYWYSTQSEISTKKYIVLGLLLGLNFLVRWQNCLLIIFLLPDFLSLLSKRSSLKYYFYFAFSFLIAALPQFLAWKIIYGHFFLKPPSNSPFSHAFNPAIFSFLASPHYGMLAWTPLYIVALIGLVLFAKKYPRLGWLIFIFIILEIYVNSGVEDWWGGGGGSFGARRMLDYSVFYALGLAYLIEKIKLGKAQVYILSLAAALFVFANLSLMIQASRGWLDAYNPNNGQIGLSTPSFKSFMLNSKKLTSEFSHINSIKKRLQFIR
jgi:hypothetical protein